MSDNVLSFTGKKDELIEQKRRGFERLVFQKFLGAYASIDAAGTIYNVELVDISHDGCLFQIPWKQGADKKYAVGESIPFRMYFSEESYIPVNVIVRHASEHHEHGTSVARFGCEFDKGHPSFTALASFIEFLYKFAEHSVVDKGSTRSLFI